MILFRQTNPVFPFLWESTAQPEGRWHGTGEGPVHYFADTPDGAWAEFLRHQDIHDPIDLQGIRRTLWAVEVPSVDRLNPVALPHKICVGGFESYPVCQNEARRLKSEGAPGLVAPSAALYKGKASGFRVDQGLKHSEPRDAKVFVLFGARPELVGWIAAAEGRPLHTLIRNVRYFRDRKYTS